MKQILLYTGAVLLLAGAVVSYRYVQQQSQTELHVARPTEEKSEITSTVPVDTGLPRTPPAPVTAVMEPAQDAVEEPALASDGSEAADTGAQYTPAASTSQAGLVQYTAPPNPGAAALGEFARHFQKRLNSMPPGERDAAKLSRRMQGEYNKAHSSLTDAIKKSREGQ